MLGVSTNDFLGLPFALTCWCKTSRCIRSCFPCFLGLVCLLADLLLLGPWKTCWCKASRRRCFRIPLSPLPSLFAFFASCAFLADLISFSGQLLAWQTCYFNAFSFLPVTYSFSLLCCFLGLVCLLADLLPLGPALGLEDLLVQGFTAPLLQDPPVTSSFSFCFLCFLCFWLICYLFRASFWLAWQTCYFNAFSFLPVTYSFSLLCCFLGLVCLLADLLPLGPALGLEDLLVQGFTAPLLQDPPVTSSFSFCFLCFLCFFG